MTTRQFMWGLGAACNAFVAQAVAYLELEDMTGLHIAIMVATTVGAFALGVFAKRDTKQ